MPWFNKKQHHVLTGIKNDKLLIGNIVRDNGKKKVYSCLCDCGKTVERTEGILRKGKTTNCGCSNVNYRRNPCRIDAVSLKLYKKNIVPHAKKYNYEPLPPDEFKELILKECSYCDAPPLNSYKDGQGRYYMSDLVLKYNGIDKADPSLGYVSSNSVTACKFCNIAKNDATKEEFLEDVSKIYKRFFDDSGLLKVEIPTGVPDSDLQFFKNKKPRFLGAFGSEFFSS